MCVESIFDLALHTKHNTFSTILYVSEHYDSISLTFYPTTTRLLVQGSSNLSWVDQHLSAICEQAEHRYMQSASTWTALACRRGIGLKREGYNTHQTRSLSSSQSNGLHQASLALPSNDHSEQPESGASCTLLVPHALQSPCTDLGLNGYPSFYPWIALVAPSPGGHHWGYREWGDFMCNFSTRWQYCVPSAVTECKVHIESFQQD